MSTSKLHGARPGAKKVVKIGSAPAGKVVAKRLVSASEFIKTSRTTAKAVTVKGVPLGQGISLGKGKGVVKSYVSLYHSPLIDQSRAAKAGVHSGIVKRLAVDMGLEQSTLTDSLGLPRSTIARKMKYNSVLSKHESERVLMMAALIGQVATIVEESGDSKGFDAAAWIGQWIETPLPALGNQKPAEFMDTAAGQQLVSQLLAQSQSGAFA